MTETQIKLMNIIEAHFEPLNDVSRQKTILCTADIYKKLQSLWPSDEYEVYDVHEALKDMGVEGVNSETSSRYFWLLQDKL